MFTLSSTATPPVGLTATVNLSAIAENTRALRAVAGSASVMAVVKADGYGHGALPVAAAALEAGATEVGVTNIAEALALRAGGITAPILSWLNVPGADYDAAIEGGIAIGVASVAQLAEVTAAAATVGQTAVVALKLDTGMGRNGFVPADLDAAMPPLARAIAAGSVVVDSTFSHLACAEEPGGATNAEQARRLFAGIDRIRSHGVAPGRIHLANSAGTLADPALHFDLVRPGVALYGYSPFPVGEDSVRSGSPRLRPVLSLTAPVVAVKRIAAGTGVSYGHTWVAPRDTVVALIPAGYADGVSRRLSNKLRVAIGERAFPGVGRVCMDQFVVDLGPDGGGVREGDRAILFGDPELGAVDTAHDWARMTDEIDHQVLVEIRGRVERHYVRAEAS